MNNMDKRKLTPTATPRKLRKKTRLFSPAKVKGLSPSKLQLGNTTVTAKQKNVKVTIREFRRKAMFYLENSQYKSLFRTLSKIPAARGALGDVLASLTRQEMKQFLSPKQDCWLKAEISLENLENFQWWDVFRQSKEHCPLLAAALTGAISRAQMPNFIKREKRLISVAPVVCVATAMLAFARKPKTANYFQQMNSIQMWLSGCKRELFGRFNHLGWNMGIKASRRYVDQVVSAYDATVNKWKINLEKALGFEKGVSEDKEQGQFFQPLSMDVSPVKDTYTGDDEDDEETLNKTLPYVEGAPLQSTPIHGSAPKSFEDSTMHIESKEMSEPEKDEDLCGFTLCFDNVNQKIGVRHQKKDRQPKMFNMVQLYAAKDRISSLDLSDEPPEADDILKIALSDLLPTPQHETMLKEEFETMVSRILCQSLKVFQGLHDETRSECDSQYPIGNASHLDETPHRKQVALGVLDKDETKSADMVEILMNYHQYVPCCENGEPFTTLLYGDGLSCERANDAQGAVINTETSWERLEGLEPCVQEWHKRVILLQDAFDSLYNGSSAKEKGTLFHLKQCFGHKKVNKEVKADFNHNLEFFLFVVEGYILLAALHELGISSLAENPSQCTMTKEERVQLLGKISRAVVNFCFERQNVEAVLNSKVQDNDMSEYEFCVCKKENPGEGMIFCENKRCSNGKWFHLSCMGMEEDDIPEGDWFCSVACTKAANKAGKLPGICRVVDGKREYVRAVIWHGLNLIAQRDAIRENDGHRIMRHWKMDMMPFFSNHHPKYFILGLKLLCQLNGGSSPRMQHQLTWNRTVNNSGGLGKNIEMDLQMEFFNREYKESAKESAGQLTEASVARHSRLVGTRKRLQQIYDLQVAQKPSETTRKHTGPNRSTDLKEMVSMLRDEDFFTVRPGRHFRFFEQFRHSIKTEFPRKMKARILMHLKKFASRKQTLATMKA